MKTKLIHRLRAALLGLAVACAAGFTLAASAQTITGTNEIVFTDFDNTIPGGGGSYTYFYSWNFPGVNTPPEDPQPGTAEFVFDYVDPLLGTGPVVYRFTFNDTAYEGPVTTNSGGVGTGFGMPLNWGGDSTVFNSTTLTDYIFSWDARVEGLKPSQTTANCEMQLRLGADGSRVLNKNYNYNPGSNWTHYTFTFEDGAFGDGTSYTTFTNGLATGFSWIAVNQNQHMPNDQFGFDDNNAIFLDNLKIEVIQYSAPTTTPPIVPVTILDWNFDDKPLWWGSGGWNWSANPSPAIPTGTYSYGTNAAGDQGAINTLGVGGSSGWVLWMTNSQLAAPNTPQWCGIGMNGGGPEDSAQWTSPDLARYQLSFDCRVQGLAVDKLSTTANAKIALRAPDNTIQPPDGDTDIDTVVTLVFPVTVETNWQTFKTTLNLGGASDGTAKTNFALYYNKIDAVMGQYQVENLQQGADWDYDDNNAVIFDNWKLVRLAVACPPLNVQTLGNNVVVTWAQPATGSAKLQSSTTANGTYTDVIGATSPYPTPISGAPKYFRTQWVAP